MARTLHLRYDAHVENPLTDLSAQQISLFSKFLYQFKQVLTWRESNAFIRLCEARQASVPGKSFLLERYTLATAELTRGNFTPFVLQPHTNESGEPHPALPPELATRFVLQAPADFQFPAEVIGLLKAGPQCYLEAGSYALVYHTYHIVPVSQLQPMRLRVQQFARALAKIEPPIKKASVIPTDMVTETQVQTLLQMHGHVQKTGASRSGFRYVYLGVGLLFVFGMLWVAQYVLHHWVH